MKNLYLTVLVSVIILAGNNQSSAQNKPVQRWPKAPNGKIVCFTDEMEKYRSVQSGLPVNNTVFEKWVSDQTDLLNNNSGNLYRTNPIIYTIPVIFHIIHNGEAVGVGRNIAKAFIDSQIVQLNNDFRRKAGTSGFNSHADGADVEIQFAPAILSPTNTVLTEPGIERINRNSRGWTAPPHMDTYMNSTVKPASFWNPDQYINIWICDLIDSAGSILGYAQQPIAPGNIGQDDDTATIAATDGIVLDYGIIGSSNKKPAGAYPFDEGRILTHEMGHFFSLRHVWGEGNCDLDDYVFDTPRQNGVLFGCNITSNSCNDTQYGSPGDSIDMVRNYMQYSDNACVNIFTIGQKNRMRVILGETGVGSPRRASLRFSDRCLNKPLVSFISTDTTVMERTTCNLPWGFNIPVSISRKPAAVTNVKFTITGNTDGNDYTIYPDSVSFSPTDTADKNFTIAIKADAVMEGHEKANFYLTISDTNALAAADPYELTIMNDDFPPVMGKRFSGTLFYEDFETPSSGWKTYDYIKGANRWLIGGTNGDVSSGKSAYISKDSSSLTYNGTSMSHTLLYHQVDAYNWDSLTLSFYYKCKGQNTNGVKKDFGKIMYSTDSLNFYQVNGTPDLTDSSNSAFFSAPIPYFLWNTKFYLGFFWQNNADTANDPPFAIDEITITGKTFTVAQIQTAVDTATGFCEKPLGPFETVDFYDRFTGDVLATIQNLSGFNYGCVKVEVDRAGTGAQWVTGDPQTYANTKLFDKTYKVTPENNNATGNYNITFYITQAEYQGWQLASTNPLALVKMIKYSGPISTMSITSNFEKRPITAAAYLGGIDKTFTSYFNSGFSGFGFGNINQTVLAADLLSFTAVKKTSTVVLNWKASNEINLSHYLITRSKDGINFLPIGTVTAAGNNTAYTFTDALPVNGNNFYRLTMTDKDGNIKKSNIVFVDFSSKANFKIINNPFTGKLDVLAENTATAVTATLIDMTGKIVLTKKYNTTAGNIFSLDVMSIARGVFYLKLYDGQNTTTFKVVKQ